MHSNDDEPPELARIAKIKPLSHYDFLEKISEGLFIEAFNSAHVASEHINLQSYKLQDLEGAISAKQAVAGQQRRPMKRSRQLFADGDLLPANEDRTGHVIRAVPKWAIERGRAYCALSVCPESAGKASSSSHRHKQAPRAKAGNGVWCMGCEQAYHAGCFAVYHRCVKAFDDLDIEAPPPKKARSSSTPADSKRPGKKRAGSSGSVEDGSDDHDDSPF